MVNLGKKSVIIINRELVMDDVIKKTQLVLVHIYTFL